MFEYQHNVRLNDCPMLENRHYNVVDHITIKQYFLYGENVSIIKLTYDFLVPNGSFKL
jgi:hypothetical protein